MSGRKKDNIISGTLQGGKRAAQTNKARHGEDYYKELGRLGGSKKVPKGFAVNRELARIAGAKGGRNSRRGKAK